MATEAAVMTYAEMEAAYDGEWVLIGEPELSAMNEVRRGTVLFHSKSQDAVYREAMRRSQKRAAILYMGARPTDVDFLL